MPIKMGKKSFAHFKQAEAYVKRTRPDVGDPGAYTASIARAQGDIPGKSKRKKKKAT